MGKQLSSKLLWLGYFFILTGTLVPLLLTYILPQRSALASEEIANFVDVFETALKRQEDEMMKGNETVVGTDYRLSFSLLVSDKNQGIDLTYWEIEEAIQRHFSRFMRALTQVTAINFEYDSQVLYYATIGEEPIGGAKDGSPKFSVDVEQLKRFHSLNAFEPGSVLSNDLQKNLHFMVYLTQTGDQYILRGAPVLENTAGAVEEQILENVYIPDYGGVVLLSSDPKNIQRFAAGQHQEESRVMVLESDSLGPAFEVFGTHLLKLLGIAHFFEDHSPVGGYDTGILDEEDKRRALAAFFVSRYSHKALANLRSVLELVHSMPHINIPEQVGSLCSQAIQELGKIQIDRIHQPVTEQQLLEDVKRSKAAFRMTETALFNNELVPQLYFGTVQLLATLAPLLAPVSLPLVLNLITELRRLRKN